MDKLVCGNCHDEKEDSVNSIMEDSNTESEGSQEELDDEEYNKAIHDGIAQWESDDNKNARGDNNKAKTGNNDQPTRPHTAT